MSFIGDNEDTHNQQPPPTAGAQHATKGSQVVSQAPSNTQQVFINWNSYIHVLKVRLCTLNLHKLTMKVG